MSEHVDIGAQVTTTELTTFEGDGDTTSAVAQWIAAKRTAHSNVEAAKRAVPIAR